MSATLGRLTLSAGGDFPFRTSISTSVSKADLDVPRKDIANIQKYLSSGGNTSNVTSSNVVSIGGVFFGGDDDVLYWINKHLPPSCPFGVFVDTYDLFVSQKGGNIARAMEAI